ncbi:MAG: FecR domain-containing protein, partial [Verrucomicrobiota bacterium]
MKTSPVRSVILVAGLVLGSLSAVAASAPNEATVLKVTGTATATLPGGGTPQTLRVNDKIPQGATINTGAGAEVHIAPFSGSVATINQNSSVSLDTLSLQTDNGGRITKQTAKLNLKSGNLVSTIDPSKKDINDYGVGTPKGVAAARGTQFTTVVTAGDVTISANADTVQFTQANGSVVSISKGEVLITPAPIGGVAQPATKVTLASLANSNSAEAVAAKAAIAAGVTAMATVLQNNLGNLSAQSATDLAAKVVAVGVIADPTNAGRTAATIVNAMTTTTAEAATGGGSQAPNNSAEAVNAIIKAAVEAAPSQAASISTAAGSAAPPAMTVA